MVHFSNILDIKYAWFYIKLLIKVLKWLCIINLSPAVNSFRIALVVLLYNYNGRKPNYLGCNYTLQTKMAWIRSSLTFTNDQLVCFWHVSGGLFDFVAFSKSILRRIWCSFIEKIEEHFVIQQYNTGAVSIYFIPDNQTLDVAWYRSC